MLIYTCISNLTLSAMTTGPREYWRTTRCSLRSPMGRSQCLLTGPSSLFISREALQERYSLPVGQVNMNREMLQTSEVLGIQRELHLFHKMMICKHK